MAVTNGDRAEPLFVRVELCACSARNKRTLELWVSDEGQ